ncbi:hypothetical protein LTR94_036190, partial [Friedmanniomyces endolithicus]
MFAAEWLIFLVPFSLVLLWASGTGPRREVALRAFLAAGADVLTLGNHSWDRKEIIGFIDGEPRLIRPMNYPPGTPGRGATVVEVPGGRKAL